MDSLSLKTEVLKVELFKEVFPQFPEGAKLFVGYDIPEVICDDRLEHLIDYIDTKSKAPERIAFWYDGCINLTTDSIKYLLEVLVKYPLLILYFIHYAVTYEDDVLMLVFDGDSISLKSTIKVSPKLYKECNENHVFVSFEDNVIF